MNILLSLNNNFFKLPPKEFIKLVKTIDNKNIVKGFEVYTDSDDAKKYLYSLAEECKDNDYILSVHLPCFTDIKEYFNYLDYLNEISNIYKRNMVMVLHPIYDSSKLHSIKITEEYVKNLLEYIKINNYNLLSLSLENLNNMNGFQRLKKEDFRGILEKYENLHFTYDIGHEYIDGTLKLETDLFFIKKLNNIHIHTFKGEDDHQPIQNFHSDNILLDKVLQINKNGYEGLLVLEYALDFIDGSNFEEQIKNYIQYAEQLYSFYFNY